MSKTQKDAWPTLKHGERYTRRSRLLGYHVHRRHSWCCFESHWGLTGATLLHTHKSLGCGRDDFSLIVCLHLKTFLVTLMEFKVIDGLTNAYDL